MSHSKPTRAGRRSSIVDTRLTQKTAEAIANGTIGHLMTSGSTGVSAKELPDANAIQYANLALQCVLLASFNNKEVIPLLAEENQIALANAMVEEGFRPHSGVLCCSPTLQFDGTLGIHNIIVPKPVIFAAAKAAIKTLDPTLGREELATDAAAKVDDVKLHSGMHGALFDMPLYRDSIKTLTQWRDTIAEGNEALNTRMTGAPKTTTAADATASVAPSSTAVGAEEIQSVGRHLRAPIAWASPPASATETGRSK